MWNMQGTQEHDDMARATASVAGGGMKRKGQGWSWGGRGKGETLWLHSPHPQGAPIVPGSPHLPWPPKIPSLVLPLALVAPSFAPLDLFSPDRFSSRMIFRA